MRLEQPEFVKSSGYPPQLWPFFFKAAGTKRDLDVALVDVGIIREKRA